MSAGSKQDWAVRDHGPYWKREAIVAYGFTPLEPGRLSQFGARQVACGVMMRGEQECCTLRQIRFALSDGKAQFHCNRSATLRPRLANIAVICLTLTAYAREV
jgi:hypothetical protein